MENYIVLIIGCAFILLLLCVLTPVIASNKGLGRRTRDEEVLIGFLVLSFFLMISLQYSVQMVVALIKRNTELYMTLFLSGAITEDFFAWMFIYMVPYKEGRKIMRGYAVFKTLFTVVATSSIFTVDGSHAHFYCAVATVVFFITMCTYRIIIMGMIIETSSVEFTPCLACLFMFLAPALWFVLCLLQRDVFAAVANAFVTLLGAVQLLIYAIYFNRVVQPNRHTANESLEMPQVEQE